MRAHQVIGLVVLAAGAWQCPTGLAQDAQEAPAPAAPHQARPLELRDLEQIALESNPTLEQARMAVRAAQGRYVQAGLYPNPVVGYSGEDVGTDGTSGQQGAVFGQEIVTAGKLQRGRAVAGREIEQARYRLEAQQWRVLNGVRRGYYEVLLAQRMVALNEELVRIGDEGLSATEKIKAALEVSRVDVLQARVEAERARLGLVQARNDHRTAWRRLAAVLGRPDVGPAPLAGDVEAGLPDLRWDDCLAALLAQSPELAGAQAGVERARCELARQCALRVPNVEVEAGVKHDAAVRTTLADVQVAVPLPVFNRNQGNILAARAALAAAEREVRRVELSLQERLADRFGKYVNARRQVETYARTILPSAKESLTLVSGHFPESFGYIELLTAQRTFFSASLEYLSALRELWTQSVEIEGLLLAGALDSVE